MINKSFYLMVFLSLCMFSVFAQKKNASTNDNKPFTYKSAWAKVDSLEDKGLIKSALEIVNTIEKKAKDENNVSQVIKTRIYQIKYRNQIEENAFETILSEMNNESYKAPFPYSSLYHSLCAELYWRYYQANRYRFLNRTYSPDEGNDMRSWSLKHLTDIAIKHHLKALEQKEQLQKIPLSQWKDILVEGVNTENLRPTLYDFIAFRAVEFFTSKETALSKPTDAFELNDSVYFSDAPTFIQLHVTSADTLSLQYYGIKILQDILAFHINDSKPEAFMDAELERLNFVYQNTALQDKNRMYLNALKRLENQYQSNPNSTAITYQIAQTLNSLSSQYSPFDSTTFEFKSYKKQAYQLAKKAIETYPKALYAAFLNNLIDNIETPTLSFIVEEVNMPDKPFILKFNYSNIKQVFVSVRSINKENFENLTYNNYGNPLISKLYQSSTPVYNTTITLPEDDDFNEHSMEEIIPKLAKGFYIVMTSSDQNFENNKAIRCFQKLIVSSLSMVSERLDDYTYKIIVTDRETGKPLPNAEVTEYKLLYGRNKDNYIKGKSTMTDQNGMTTILTADDPFRKKYDGTVYVKVKYNDESLMSEQNFYSYNYYNNEDTQEKYSVNFFTDRAIYRPGQTVYYKGIVLKSKGKERNIVSGYAVNVALRDANYQVVEEKLMTTNDFGTFNGSFQIPEGQLNGMYSLNTNEGSISFRVEEYKRPRFLVTVETAAEEYVLNDSVKVNATVKSYAGVALQNIPVKYHIVRIPRWRGYWYWYRPMTSTEIASGTVQTNDTGCAVIHFKAIPDVKYPLNENTFYEYSITVDATDINNETQSAATMVSAGTVSLFFNVVLKSLVNTGEISKILFTTNNANGVKLTAKGSFNVYTLEGKTEELRNRLWQRPDKYKYTKEEWDKLYPGNVYMDPTTIYQFKSKEKIYSGTFDTKTDTAIALPTSTSWVPGPYMLEFISKDSKGRDVHHKEYFTVYADGNATIPSNNPLFMVSGKTTYKPGETAKIYIGSAYDHAWALVGISYFDSSESYQWLELKDKKQSVIEIPIEEKHRGNIFVSCMIIAQSRIYQQSIYLTIPFDNKDLKIVTETFRSKLIPGEQETWKLKITGPKGEKVTSELLASMYDKSLDAFVPHQWYFYPFPYYYSNSYFSADMFSTLNSSCYSDYKSAKQLPVITYPQLNWFGFYYSYYSSGYKYDSYKTAGRSMTMAKKNEVSAQMMEEDEITTSQRGEAAPSPPAALEEKIATTKDKTEQSVDGIVTANQVATGGEMANQEKPVSIRNNLNETAFFLPTLLTNEQGEVTFSFKAPEALTTWKFMAFAHSKDLKFGTFQKECMTQKELMVTPQLPRFFREGDSLLLYVKVDNLSDEAQQVNVKFTIENALSNEKTSMIKLEKQVTIKAKRSEVVYFPYQVPYRLSLVKVTTTAQSKSFSDGEETVLPILPNRMLVTESLPFYVRGKQQKQIDFKRMIESSQSTTLTNEALTLEYTANPIWYAVLAIPYLRSFPYECNEQVFNRYYANKLSQYIVSSIPDFKKVFDTWLQDTLNKPLLSPLSKNEDLKNSVLAETPWVEESMDETEQRQNIALYFDERRINKEMKQAAAKLIKNQYPNGSWSWFPGMPESRYITQYIVASNGRLDKSYPVVSQLENAMSNAVDYLDRQIEKDYRDLKRYLSKDEMEKYQISSFQIQYLYARSFYLNKHKDFLKSEPYLYFYGQAKKYWLNTTEYMQGMTALVLYRGGDITTAQLIIKSLGERTVVSEEQGMYWKSISRGLLWTEAPIEAQSLLIEAFNEIGKDPKIVNELKLWLLLQKQTQNWKTTTATADAIYALLFNGKTELTTSFDADILWGNQPIIIEKTNVENATGHIKEKIEPEKINNSYAKVQITNKGNDISWGAIHWQYFEDLDKISGYENKYMSIKREYFIERITPSGKVLEPMSNGQELHIGDVVIVRLVLECDRKLEYVHIKDMRPASFEPMQVLSGYSYKDGLGYYGETKDASYNFFIDTMNRGKYVLEYSLRVSQKGKFSTGITTIQCMYAPEFNAHAQGMIVYVK